MQRQSQLQPSSTPDIPVARDSEQGDDGHQLPTKKSRFERESSKKRVGTWTDKQMSAAKAALERGEPIRTVAGHFDIPQSTLADHVHGRILKRKNGLPTVLNEVEEKALEEYIINIRNCGYPLTMDDLKYKVAEIVQTRVIPFQYDVLGSGWLKWFKKRHPNLSLRCPEGLEITTARALNPKNVKSFYSNLMHLYMQHNDPAERIWNCNETEPKQEKMEGGWCGQKPVHDTCTKSFQTSESRLQT